MKTSQKRAIWYAYREKEEKAFEKLMEENEEFKRFVQNHNWKYRGKILSEARKGGIL